MSSIDKQVDDRTPEEKALDEEFADVVNPLDLIKIPIEDRKAYFSSMPFVKDIKLSWRPTPCEGVTRKKTPCTLRARFMYRAVGSRLWVPYCWGHAVDATNATQADIHRIEKWCEKNPPSYADIVAHNLRVIRASH